MNYWLENLEITICVVKPKEGKTFVKDIPSTEGMKYSYSTSEFMKMKLEKNLSEQHIQEIVQAFRERDFNKVAEITMKESN